MSTPKKNTSHRSAEAQATADAPNAQASSVAPAVSSALTALASLATQAAAPGQLGQIDNLGLVGRYDHTLDPKKRLKIPAELFHLMGSPENLFVMPDPYAPCLLILPPVEMRIMVEKLRKMPYFNEDVSDALESLGGQSEFLQLDTARRIRICDAFLEFAELESDVVIIGAANRIRLWAPRHRPLKKQVDQSKLSAALKTIGLV